MSSLRHRGAAGSLLLLFSIACASPPPPPEQGVGSLLPGTSIEDQFGEVHTLGDDVRLILMTRDMEAGEVARAAIELAGPATLAGPEKRYVSDISGMPGLIATMFAIPRMRDRPYALLLDRDGTFTARFPSEPARVTLLIVEERRIREIRHLAEPEEIAALLGEE